MGAEKALVDKSVVILQLCIIYFYIFVCVRNNYIYFYMMTRLISSARFGQFHDGLSQNSITCTPPVYQRAQFLQALICYAILLDYI